MKAFLNTLLAKSFALLAGTIILFAILTVAARFWLPHAHDLREHLSGRLGDFLDVQVDVGGLALTFDGLEPTLTLTDAELRDPHTGDHLLGMRALRVSLDAAASLQAGQPRISGITLVGARIEVRRDSEGRIALRGLTAVRTGDDRAAMTFFLREGRFSLADSTLYWTDGYARTPTLRFDMQRLDIINHGRHHLLRARAAPPGDTDGELLLRADLTGPPGQPEVWSGRIAADWRGSDLARLLRGRLPAKLRLATDSLHLTSWNRLQDGRLSESLNRVWLDNLVLRRTDDGRTLDLGDVSTLVRWRSEPDGWHLQLADLELFGSILRPERTNLSLRLRRPPADQPDEQPDQGEDAPISGARLIGGLGELRLQPLAEAVAFFSDALSETPDRLIERGIEGRLSRLAWRAELGANGQLPTDWRVKGQLLGLGVAGHGAIPPLRGLDLWIDAGPSNGNINLDATDTEIDLRPMLAEPTRFVRMNGSLYWRLMPAGSIHLWTRALSADTADFASVSRLSLCAHPSGASPFINLHTHLNGTSGEDHAAVMARYLPVAVMDDQLEAWLAQAVVAGHLDSGDILFRGKPEDFPFDDNEGRFLVELRLRDGILDYQPPKLPREGDSAGAGAVVGAAGETMDPGWPRLEEIDATLRFEDRALEIEVARGRLLETELLSGRVTMPNLWQPRYLSLRAHGVGPATDGMRVLAETPLARQLGGIPRAFQVTGEAGIELALEIPLQKRLPFQYAGSVTLDGTPTATLLPAGLELTAIDGTLRFDREGVRADGIRTRLDDLALGIGVATRDPGTEQARTEIGIDARTSVSQLRQRLPSPLWQLAQGAVDWRLDLTLKNTDAVKPNPPMALALRSELTGLSVAAPEPLGKRAGESRPFTLTTRLDGVWPMTLSAGYGAIGARLELAQNSDKEISLQRATIDLGVTPERLPDARGIQLGGNLERLDLGPWLDWVGSNAELLQPRTGGDAGLPVLPSRLRVEALRLGALRLRDVDASITPTNSGGWSVRFTAADGGGAVELPAPASNGAIAVRLDRLDLEPLLDAEQTEPETGATAKPPGRGSDPRRIGRIALDIGELRHGENTLGRLRLSTQPTALGVRLAELSLEGPLVTARGEGGWTLDTTDYATSAIELRLQSTDLGQLLRDMGNYSSISGAPSTAELQLSWPGGPGELSLSGMRGSVDATLGAGRLTAVEPGVGRMLGILNLGALQRRLSLDFSDVFEEGFGFDQITGQLAFGNGQARIGQLEILSSTADIRITGTTDLLDQTFEQSVRVTPKIGTGVALAGAVAGGPLVGAAVFLADKLTGGAVEQLGSYEYQVTGPWKKPVIRRVAGSQGALSVPDLFADQPKPQGGEQMGSPGAPGTAGDGGNTVRQKQPNRPTDDNPFLEGF
jgi:uncharacterized protein (TIGR02099 family)